MALVAVAIAQALQDPPPPPDTVEGGVSYLLWACGILVLAVAGVVTARAVKGGAK